MFTVYRTEKAGNYWMINCFYTAFTQIIYSLRPVTSMEIIHCLYNNKDCIILFIDSFSDFSNEECCLKFHI